MGQELKTRANSKERAIAAAILQRAGVKVDGFGAEKREVDDVADYSLVELAREACRTSGVDFGGFPSEIAGRAMTTSDFPLVLADVASKSMESSYGQYQSTFSLWTTPKSTNNFHQGSIVRVAPPSELPLVDERGEFKYLSISEGNETYQIVTRGGIIPLSRQVIINDDVGAFADVGRLQALTAVLTQARMVYGKLLSNPSLSDGVSVFDASRGNLLSGEDSALSRDSLAEALKVVRMFSDDRGNPLMIEPKYLLVPPSLEMTAHELCFSDSAPGQTNSSVPNIFKKIGLIPIVEPLLESPALTGSSSTAWYLLPDPNISPFFATIALGSADNLAPYIDSKPGWVSDNIEFKTRIDFGVAAIGHKAVKSAGV